jgi:hypothetical protein
LDFIFYYYHLVVIVISRQSMHMADRRLGLRRRELELESDYSFIVVSLIEPPRVTVRSAVTTTIDQSSSHLLRAGAAIVS